MQTKTVFRDDNMNGYFIRVTDLLILPFFYAFVQWDWGTQELKKERKNLFSQKDQQDVNHILELETAVILKEKKENPRLRI